MKKTNGSTPGTRAIRGRTLRVESLEDRTLLTGTASESFAGPSLTALIREALRGQYTAPATISTMTQALQTQLDSGPLANLTAGTVNANDFVSEAESLESSYEAYAASELLPRFPNVDEMIDLQGQAVVSDLVALNQANSVGLTSTTTFEAQAMTAIGTLTNGPVFALGTPLSGFTTATQTFDNALNVVSNSLSSTASPSLTPANASATVIAEAEAYRATVHAGLQVTHSNISSAVDTAVNNLEAAAQGIASATNQASAQSQLTAAIAAFDAAITGTTGVFGADGLFVQTGGQSVPTSRTPSQSSTTLFVAGTAPVGGPAILTATLTSTSTGLGISGQIVRFTLDGAFVGTAVTNGSGVATLSSVPTSDPVGSDTNGVVATFGGNASNYSSVATGNLVVSQAATVLSNVGGTAAVGGTATLVATLTNSTTSAPISGKTVTFELNGSSVGTAVTNSSGVATLSDVTTTATATIGTQTGIVSASFAGDADDVAAPAVTGDLVVSQVTTALTSVGGTAVYGSTATLTATLVNSVTNAGIAGETVTFELNGAAAGTGTTNSNGVATVTGVASSAAVGTQTGVVSASFAGDTNNAPVAAVTGNLVTSQATTSLGTASGTATYGGTATLTATLTNTTTSAGIANEPVQFTLNGVNVGSPVNTNSSGVATLTGVTSSAGAGTQTGIVGATFVGDTNNAASTATLGNLVTAQATTALGTASGTATYGGTATLTVTLTNATTSAVIANEPVQFTLNGVNVGAPVNTNGSGVATLTGVTSTADAGTQSGIVGATFAGDTNYAASTATAGDLVTSQAATSFSAVSGTGTVASGMAMLTATLTSSVTSAGIPNETVTFTLDGTNTTAMTDASGVATVTVATADTTGTYPDAVGVTFTGDTNYSAAPAGSGTLTMS